MADVLQGARAGGARRGGGFVSLLRRSALAACAVSMLGVSGHAIAGSSGGGARDGDLLLLAELADGAFALAVSERLGPGDYAEPYPLDGIRFESLPDGLPDVVVLRSRVNGLPYGSLHLYDRAGGALRAMNIDRNRVDFNGSLSDAELFTGAAPQNQLFSGESVVIADPAEATAVPLSDGSRMVFVSCSTGFSRTGVGAVIYNDPFAQTIAAQPPQNVIPLDDGLIAGGGVTRGALAEAVLGPAQDAVFLDSLTPTRGGIYSVVLYEPATGGFDRITLPEEIFEVSTLVTTDSAFLAVLPQQLPEIATTLLRIFPNGELSEVVVADERFVGGFGTSGVQPVPGGTVIFTDPDAPRRLWSVDAFNGAASVIFELAVGGPVRSESIVALHDVAVVSTEPNPCRADITTLDRNPGELGYGQPDGSVNVEDLTFFVEVWISGDPLQADVTTLDTNPGEPGYGVPDGQVNVEDLTFQVEQWIVGCGG